MSKFFFVIPDVENNCSKKEFPIQISKVEQYICGTHKVKIKEFQTFVHFILALTSTRKIANSKIELACHTQEAETDRTRTCNTDGTCRISTRVVAVARVVARALTETCLSCSRQVVLAAFDFQLVPRVVATACAVVRCRSRGSAASAARSECTLRSSALPDERKSNTPASRRPPLHTRSRPR